MCILDWAETKRVRRANTALKYGYQIIVFCRVAHCAVIEHIVREQLDAAGLAIDEISHQANGDQCLARVAARVHCTIAERSTLLRLVSRLEHEPDVRSVRWESVLQTESS